MTTERLPQRTNGRIDDAYDQSKDDLQGLPQLTEAPRQRDNMPNIFRIRTDMPDIWRQTGVRQHFVKATKVDIGGVGGHVETAPLVDATVLQHVLENNRWKDGPIFKSVFATHTGDDVAIVGVVDERIAQTDDGQAVVDQLLWDAFHTGTAVAEELGLYGPGQDLLARDFTGNLHGAGPASVTLPLPIRDENFSQTVLMTFGDKTEPGLMNHLTLGAFLNPRVNTGLLIAESAMKRGYVFEIIDLDTKAQALESGVNPTDQQALDAKMAELGQTERFIELRGPEDLQDLMALTMSGSRFVVARIFTKDEKSPNKKGQLGIIVSAERLHNIQTAKGFVYGGKDDPVALFLCQSDWPAPGEITAPLANTPLVAGDCRGSHHLPLYPAPLGTQTSFWSGPIISVITASIHIRTGRIGAISDQLAAGTPWDQFRQKAAERMLWFRNAHGSANPGTLPVDELEYQPGYQERMARLNPKFNRRDA